MTEPASGRWPYELIDLSRPLTTDTVDALFGDIVADGQNAYFRDFTVEVTSDHTNATAYSCRLTIPDHIGTHMDATIHTVPGGTLLEAVDLRQLIGEAVVLDLDRGGIDHGYEAEELAEAARAAEGGGIRPGDIVLLYSGFQDTRPGERMRQTWLTPGAAQWLVDQGAAAVGMEPATPDPLRAGIQELGWTEKDGPNRPAWPAHMTLLGNGVLIIEGLTNLDRIRGRRVRFAALPPLIPGLSGCPVRAVAWLDAPRS